MLMTKLKSKDEILSLTSGSFFVINCHGCKEVGFPEEDAKALEKAKSVGMSPEEIRQITDILLED